MADMLKKIPGGITADDFMAMRNFLLEVRNQVGAKQVIMRLNRTGEEIPAPVFVSWVEDDAIAKRRTEKERNEPDPGLFRFGDSNYSVVYNQTISAGPGVLRERSWTRPYAEKSDQAKALVQEADLNYQRYIGIIVGDGKKRRCVGTLSVAFSDKPDARSRASIDQVLKNWALESRSPLVIFLRSHLAVSGPNV